MSRTEQLRQLAVQLASLASVEDVVTHRPQSLLAPISVDERALLALLSRLRSRALSAIPCCSRCVSGSGDNGL